MTNDYDIVIIGGSLAGYQAALTATHLRAKVALVEPQINYEWQYYRILGEIAQKLQQSQGLAHLGIYPPDLDRNGVNLVMPSLPGGINWEKLDLYAQGVGSNLEQQYALSNLTTQGVDVILGDGEFQAAPRLGFKVGDGETPSVAARTLYSRTYILATGSRPAIPKIEGLQTVSYLTLANIDQTLQQANPPQNWVILGGLPQSIEIAQTLALLGYRVTLIVKHRYLLPEIDPELNQLLIAQLEVNGVRILTHTTVTQVREINGEKWVQAGDKAINTEAILVATKQRPNLEFLNLAAVGVKWHQHKLIVNKKLQTTNHRIYACGDILGGYSLTNIAQYEANLILQNALFFPKNSVNYRCVPWGIHTQPMLAQVGLTETEAKRQYQQNQFLVIKQYFKSLSIAQIQAETTGICKLIVRDNGEILGASIFGKNAGELINIIALAMSENIYIHKLAKLAPIYPTYTEILLQAADEWHQQKIQRNHNLQEFLESFFHFRRDWNL